MKIIITGGHFSPALSVIERLSNESILLIGRKYAFEGDKTLSYEFLTAQKMNIPFFPITTARLQRRITRHTLLSLLKFPIGFMQSFRAISSFGPDIVLSFGGYISVPVCLAAWVMKKPIILHEQTLGGGIANRLIGRLAIRVCLTFDESKIFFPKEKVIMTGNPLRKEIYEKKKIVDISENAPVLYVTGGSTGAHGINAIIFESLSDLLKKYLVIHQTGDSETFKDYQRACELKKKYKGEKNRYFPYKYIAPENIGWVLDRADIIIARAGANTVVEIIALGKKAIFIPLPQGQNNEQLRNAQLAKRLGNGMVVFQEELSSPLLVEKISKLSQMPTPLPDESYSEHAADKIIAVMKSVHEQIKKESI